MMTDDTANADPRDILRARLQEGVRVSSLSVAVLGWVCDVPTQPSVGEVSLRSGQVTMRMADEGVFFPFGSLTEFLDQTRIVCGSLGLTDAQTEWVVASSQPQPELPCLSPLSASGLATRIGVPVANAATASTMSV
jgi:hypothetical protein